MIVDPLVVVAMGVSVVGGLSAMAGQWYERRKWERRLLERAGWNLETPMPPAPASRHARAPEDESRLERLEQAVDAIAIEMERIGEGQRFVTKLLAERKPEPTERTPRSPIPGATRSAPRPPA